MRTKSPVHRHPHILIHTLVGMVSRGELDHAWAQYTSSVQSAPRQQGLVKSRHSGSRGVSPRPRHSGRPPLRRVAIRGHNLVILEHMDVGTARLFLRLHTYEDVVFQAQRSQKIISDNVTIVSSSE